jgi:hypothetical protein
LHSWEGLGGCQYQQSFQARIETNLFFELSLSEAKEGRKNEQLLPVNL